MPLKGDPSKDVSIVILGGGIAGVATALERTNGGFTNVYIIDKNNELLLGSSNCTPGRAGHGFHYCDPVTGIKYLKAVIDIVKKYPECLIGHNEAAGHYLHHGLYALMKECKDATHADYSSIFPTKKILQTYKQLQYAYKHLVDSDVTNKVFGNPDDFYRVLSDEEMSEYGDRINLENVECLVKTNEELINWPYLRNKLIEAVMDKGITVHLNAEIVDLKTTYDEQNPFSITVKVQSDINEISAACLINSTWQNISYLTQKLGIRSEERWTNRLKALMKFKIPKEHQSNNSVFFCMGEHCMFSNIGNGIGLTTYAKKTNVKSSVEVELPAEVTSYLELNTKLTDDEMTFINRNDIQTYICDTSKHTLKINDNIKLNKISQKAHPIELQDIVTLGREIKSGVAGYLPWMSHAETIRVQFGIVRTHGIAGDIGDPASPIHVRSDDEIRFWVYKQSQWKQVYHPYALDRLNGLYIENPSMKLFYGFQNAIKICDFIVSAHM